MKYSRAESYGFYDTRYFEMQILTYAHCPSPAAAPIDRRMLTLSIIEYLMVIIKFEKCSTLSHFCGPPTDTREDSHDFEV